MLTKKAKLAKLSADAKAKYAEMEQVRADGGTVSQEDINNLDAMIADGEKLRAEIEQETKISELGEFASAPAGQSQIKEGAPQRERKTWGRVVTKSQAFQVANASSAEKMDRVTVGGLKELKAIHGLTDAAGGAFVVADRDEPVMLPMRQRTVLDLISIQETGSNSVEYPRMTTRTNNAAPVLEYDTSGGDFNLKPQSNLVFELVTEAVKTIPTWVPASRNILMDAPQLRSLIDDELTYMVEYALEGQVVNGNGSSPNLTGILNTSGIQTRTQADTSDRGGEATDTKSDALRRALTDIALSFYQADGILLNPGDAEDIELEKTSEGQYVKIFDPVAQRIWRVPVVESSVIASGTALVGNFRMGATLWDRMQTDIRVGEPGQYFLQNAVAVLAEIRVAFGVKRPEAFEKVTFA